MAGKIDTANAGSQVGDAADVAGAFDGGGGDIERDEGAGGVVGRAGLLDRVPARQQCRYAEVVGDAVAVDKVGRLVEQFNQSRMSSRCQPSTVSALPVMLMLYVPLLFRTISLESMPAKYAFPLARL